MSPRRMLFALAVFSVPLLVACPKKETPQPPEQRSTSKDNGPPQYLIADPSPRGGGVTLALGSAGSFGRDAIRSSPATNASS